MRYKPYDKQRFLMNKLQGKIAAIESSDALVRIDVTCKKSNIVAFLLESTKRYDRVGAAVSILFKESEVSIAKDFSGQISLQNRFECTITKIEQGALLAQITLDFYGETIDSIISSGSTKRMNLAVGDSVVALVKSTEITLVMDNKDA